MKGVKAADSSSATAQRIAELKERLARTVEQIKNTEEIVGASVNARVQALEETRQRLSLSRATLRKKEELLTYLQEREAALQTESKSRAGQMEQLRQELFAAEAAVREQRAASGERDEELRMAQARMARNEAALARLRAQHAALQAQALAQTSGLAASGDEGADAATAKAAT
eukprot:tig00000823_g4554.t1